MNVSELLTINTTLNGIEGDEIIDKRIWQETLRYAGKSALGIILGSLSFVTFAGNVIVLRAVQIDQKLQTVSNMFILSLASADMIVGAVVMPISAVYVITEDWLFGLPLCQAWIAADYIASTASILNLLVLSLDRYWSVTNPLHYLHTRTPRRALIMTSLVWAVSFLWLLPILGWHVVFRGGQRVVPGHVCDVEYATNTILKLSTAVVNYYLPLAIMLTLYARIFKAIRGRSNVVIRRNFRTPRKPIDYNEETFLPLSIDSYSCTTRINISKIRSSSGNSDIYEKNNKEITYLFSDANTASQVSRLDHPHPETLELAAKGSNGLVTHLEEKFVGANLCFVPTMASELNVVQTKCDKNVNQLKSNTKWKSISNESIFVPSKCSKKSQNNSTSAWCNGNRELKSNFAEKGHASLDFLPVFSTNHRENDKSTNQLQVPIGIPKDFRSKQIETKTLRHETTQEVIRALRHSRLYLQKCSENSHQNSHILQNTRALQKSTELQPSPALSSSPVRHNFMKTKATCSSTSTSRRLARKISENSKENKKNSILNIVTRREHRSHNDGEHRYTSEMKAARQLGVIMGAFMICFCPYFVCFIVVALCEECIENRLMTAVTWIGYLNSTLNPFLYPLCNQQFRRTFCRILLRNRRNTVERKKFSF